MKKGLKKKIGLILFATVVLALALFLDETIFEEPETVITRKGYGEGGRIADYEVKVEGMEKERLQLEVGEQEYTAEEVQKIFQEISEKLDRIILGENESFDRVEKDLNLVTEVEDYPVEISWQMNSYSALNLYGEIQEENLKEEGTLVELRGTVSYRGQEFIYVQSVCVYPLTRTGSDKVIYELRKKLTEIEENTREKKNFSLPQSVDGKKVSWTQRKENRWYFVLFLGAALCSYVVYEEREKEKRRIRHRQEELIRTYPGIISKFTMLLGSGITVRNVWEKMVQNYEIQKENTGKIAAYEEMAVALREVQGGVPEGEAYERFGKRCGVNVYMKFGTLLAQNLRKGSRGISDILRMEAMQTFENRKNKAKRLGEEAGTKLLVPMLGMLAVVFIMVMIPAFLSMQS